MRTTVEPAAPGTQASRARLAPPVFASAAMREVLDSAEDVAQASTTVLLLGESGTGKEVLARLIHRRSGRAAGPWVAVNCAALPADLLESELFGHERGAFTGASERHIGRIEQAHGGTLLLDEISEMPLPLQAKLLRVLQEREVDRVGGGRPHAVDVRIIATSNRDLAEMVERKQFRADLYYRLCVFPIVLPPLRDRVEDIAPLADHFIGLFAESLGRPAPLLSNAARAALSAYGFPGNVRELGNLIERLMVRCREAVVDVRHLAQLGLAPGQTLARGVSAPGLSSAPVLQGAVAATPAVRADGGGSVRFLPEGLPVAIAALERLAILEALRQVGDNRTHAARLLGISLRTLRNKLREMRAEAGAVEPDADADTGAEAA